MKILKKLLLLLTASLFVITTSSCSYFLSDLTSSSETEIEVKEDAFKVPVEPYTKQVLQQASDSSVGIYVASVDHTSKMQSVHYGSGVIYRINEGTANGDIIDSYVPTEKKQSLLHLWIVTNNHVIETAATAMRYKEFYEIRIYFSSTKSDSALDQAKTYYASAKLVGRDAAADLAVLKCVVKAEDVESNCNRSLYSQNLFNRPFYHILNKGDEVFAVGNPLTLMHQGRITRGVVSLINSTSVVTDVSLNPGNSGGGLFSAYSGLLVGINVSIVRIDFKVQRRSNSIPLKTILRVLPKLEGGL